MSGAHALLVRTSHLSPFGGGVVNDSLQSHLTSLRDDHARRAAPAGGDSGAALTEDYLRDAMAALSVEYGPACAEQVGTSGPTRREERSTASAEPVPLPFLTRVRRGLRRRAEDWQRQWLEMAELGEPIARRGADAAAPPPARRRESGDGGHRTDPGTTR